MKNRICCVYCQGEHFPTKCDKVTDVNARKDILKNFSCCYLCLKTGHVSKNYTKNYICPICSKKHQVFMRKGTNNCVIKVQIQWLI